MDSEVLVTRVNSTPSKFNLKRLLDNASFKITRDIRSNFNLSKMEQIRFTRNITNIIKNTLFNDDRLFNELYKYEVKPINSKGAKKKKKNKRTKRR